jgi:hypothetical protein
MPRCCVVKRGQLSCSRCKRSCPPDHPILIEDWPISYVGCLRILAGSHWSLAGEFCSSGMCVFCCAHVRARWFGYSSHGCLGVCCCVFCSDVKERHVASLLFCLPCAWQEYRGLPAADRRRLCALPFLFCCS